MHRALQTSVARVLGLIRHQRDVRSVSGDRSSSIKHLSVNYVVTSVLYDQFRSLNKDFQLAVGGSGEFQGSVREFRRRHQTLSQSVQNADQFMMISNVAGFCCQIMNLILLFYCSIFFRNETIAEDAISAVMYIYWFLSTSFDLTLTTCQGIAINHEVFARNIFQYNCYCIINSFDAHACFYEHYYDIRQQVL